MALLSDDHGPSRDHAQPPNTAALSLLLEVEAQDSEEEGGPAGNTPPRGPARICRYVEEVVPRYTDVEFKQHFRMRRATFEVCYIMTYGCPYRLTTVHVGYYDVVMS